MLRITATGIAPAERRLRLLARRTGDMRPALRSISQVFTEEERKLFSGHAGILPIKARTVERKRRDRDGRTRANATRPLEASGFLREFLTGRHEPVRLTRSTVDLGIPDGRRDLDYARVQARSGRNPVVSARTIARKSPGIISDYLFGR